MKSKSFIVGLALVFTIVNGAIVLGANEHYKNMYTGFGIEDPDPDLDKVYSNQDKCPASPFDIFVINKSTKKNKVVITFPNDLTEKNTYLKLKDVRENNQIVVQTSSSENFSKSTSKEYIIAGNEITLIDTVGKRMRLLYANSIKGIAVVWLADAEGSTRGCTVSE